MRFCFGIAVVRVLTRLATESDGFFYAREGALSCRRACDHGYG